MLPRNILVLAEGQLGDLLLLTPALRALKTTFSDSRISVLILQRRGGRSPDSLHPGLVHEADPRGTAGVLTSSSAVDGVFELHRDALRGLKNVHRVRAESGVIRWLRRQKFDTVVCTFPEDRFAILAYLSGAKLRVGQRRQNLRWLLNLTPDIEKRERGVLEYYCDLARALGAEVDSTATEYVADSEAMNWAKECIAEQCGEGAAPVVIHPGASGDYKIWPPERFAALVDRLQELDLPVLLCGGHADRDVMQQVRSGVRHTVPAVVTEGNLQKLAGVFARSALVVSNDSGPRHLAVAAGARTLALFRRHHDREWNVYPETVRCRILRGGEDCPACPSGVCADRVPEGEQYGSHCIRMITVDHAVAAVLSMLTSS
jgi:ADP-heptose:LPS heptosyltransferase